MVQIFWLNVLDAFVGLVRQDPLSSPLLFFEPSQKPSREQRVPATNTFQIFPGNAKLCNLLSITKYTLPLGLVVLQFMHTHKNIFPPAPWNSSDINFFLLAIELRLKDHVTWVCCMCSNL